MSGRNVLLDTMRGLAIILVVVGHAGLRGVAGNWISAFHMPLFFFISGYFCNDKKAFGSFLYKKVKTLYFPFVFNYVLFIALSHILHQADMTRSDYSSLGDTLKAVLLVCRFRVGAMDLLAQFWFLPVLFFISVLFFGLLRLVRRYRLRNELALFGGGIFTLLGILGNLLLMPNPYDIQRVFYYMGYYALGWYVAQTNLPARRIPCCFTVVSFILLVWSVGSPHAILWNPLAGILKAVLGIFFSWGFCQEVKRHGSATAFLSYVGKHTMPIFVWHVFCFKCLELLLARNGLIENMSVGWNGGYATNTFVLVFLYTLAGVLLPVGFCEIKYKLFGK